MKRLHIKRLQLWIHRHYHQIRQWIVAIVGVMLLIFAMIMIVNQNQLIQRVELLSQQNKELNESTKTLARQNKELSEENQVLAKQNRAYTLCGFSLFAKYTRDRLPITDLNLETCQVGNQDDQKTNAPTPTAAKPEPERQSPQQAPSQSTTPPPPQSPPTSEPPEPTGLRRIPVVDSTLKLLGL